jgi:cytochrome b involved in lipid metabolism
VSIGAAARTEMLAAACDACSMCDDVCDDVSCARCDVVFKAILARPSKKQQKPTFTPCQLRRHATAESCWIAANKIVYDCTTFLASRAHPGGGAIIIAKAGRECTDDFKYHTKSARRLWGKMAIGKLVSCPGKQAPKPMAPPWSSGEW